MRDALQLPTAAVVFAVFTLASSGHAQSASPFAQWARSHALPLHGSQHRDRPDLRGFSEIIGEARVVAIGEPTHGAEEPLALRNALFRYLVEQHGFTAIAVESSLPDSRHLNAYVNGGPGHAGELARRYFSWGFGHFRANVELLEWMREYNGNPARTRKLQFYGIDLPLGGPDGSTPRPIAFLEPLELLATADSIAANRLRGALEPLLRFPIDSVLSPSPAQLDAWIVAADDLIRRLERSRPLLANSRADYEWAYRTAISGHDALWAKKGFAGETSGGFPPQLWENIETRDAAMARNVEWALAREGPGGRLLVFAHNGHVMNAAMRGSLWSSLAKAPNAMGVYLRSIFGSNFVTIGHIGGATTDTTVQLTRDSTGIDDTLASLALPRFALDLRTTPLGSGARNWLESLRSIRVNFALRNEVRLIEAFDAIVYTDTLRPAVSYKEAR